MSTTSNRTEIVEYSRNGLDISLTISEATILIGMKRARLRVEGARVEDEDPDIHLARSFYYPDLVAPVVDSVGIDWPPDFETFIELPDDLAAQWEAAVYRLNPHWRAAPLDEAEEKKA